MMRVTIATSADSPPRWQGEVVELDRFSAKLALETRELTLRDGASLWLHFEPPGGGLISVAGIVSGVARGGRITVLLSLSPKEYSRLLGLPEPPVERPRRAQPLPSLPGIKPIQKREVPGPRPEPVSPRPVPPAQAPSEVLPDVADLSPMERAKALAAALAELVGPSAEPAEAPVEIVAPRPEAASARPVEPAAVTEPGAELASLAPAEAAKVPVEVVEPPPESATVSPVEPTVEAPAAMVAPPLEPARVSPAEPVAVPVESVELPPEPVAPSVVEPVAEAAAMEPSAQPAWLAPAEAAEAPVEVAESLPEPAGVSPAEPAAPVETVPPPPEPAGPGRMAPLETPRPAKPSAVRFSLIARAKALGAALAGMAGPRAAPESLSPREPIAAPAESVAPPAEPVSPSPAEAVEAPVEAGVRLSWPRPVEEPSVPVEEVEVRAEPLGVTPAEPVAAPVEEVELPPEPVGVRPVEAVAAPVESVAPPPAPVSPSAVEPVEAMEPIAEPAWLEPAEEVEVPVEAVGPPPEPVGVSPAEHAEALVAQGDLEGAWKVYYDALRVAADDLRLWYGLGLTLSRLNRRKETEEIFRYVVSCGDPDSEEVKHALGWLVAAASPPKPPPPPKPSPRAVPAASPPKPAPSAVPAAPPAKEELWGVVYGKVTWREPEPPREAFLVLQGLDKDAPRRHTRVHLGGDYEFERLPPGSYHLIGGVENAWLWDLRFTVEAGQEMALDLSRENSTHPTARV